MKSSPPVDEIHAIDSNGPPYLLVTLKVQAHLLRLAREGMEVMGEGGGREGERRGRDKRGGGGLITCSV